MILNGAINVKFKGVDVKKICLGRDTVWTREAHLIVTPMTIWLQRSNGFAADVNIISNVLWDVE
jgi:hypothetical protein|nr:MAG TPA: hypothetical protein [Bacteriophage sp.]